MIFQFVRCNLILCIVITVLLALKYCLRNHLTARMQYCLWFPVLLLMILPFLPLSLPRYTSLSLPISAVSKADNVSVSTSGAPFNDYAISISTNHYLETALTILWSIGILLTLLILARSWYRLSQIRKDAPLLRNEEVLNLLADCKEQCKITKEIPIYTTDLLQSPALIGLFSPRIYLPSSLIYLHSKEALRCILLHELHHYKYKDNLINYTMCLLSVLYWFNPLVHYMQHTLTIERELACDSSVLSILEDKELYGMTLISMADSSVSLSFGSKTLNQMRKRILNINSYRRTSRKDLFKGIACFAIAIILTCAFAPSMSVYASSDTYRWIPSEPIQQVDYSKSFGEHHGTFVAYNNSTWTVYNPDEAVQRKSPNSTWKIYDALISLEASVITAETSSIPWNGTKYPFEAWNKDQTLASAMQSSVNWYFQNLDQRIGKQKLSKEIQKIDYGNKNIQSNLSSYWLESALKISPVEQVLMLKRLYYNDLGYSTENINAVKSAICLKPGKLYGKTGTGKVNNANVNGWFIGYVVTANKPFFFAVNISDGSGQDAADIALKILSQQSLME